MSPCSLWGERRRGKVGIEMTRTGTRTLTWGMALCLLGAVASSAAAQQPKRAGELIFAVAQEPPTYDGHREETFGLIHPIAPFYSVLLRVDPSDAGKLTGELA